MWKELKKKFYRKINEWYYTDKKIVKFLSDGTKAHVAENEDGIIVSFECVRCFDAEDLALFESEEKGSTEIDILGVTMVFDADDIYIAYSIDAIKEDLFDFNPLIVWSDIMDIANTRLFMPGNIATSLSAAAWRQSRKFVNTCSRQITTRISLSSVHTFINSTAKSRTSPSFTMYSARMNRHNLQAPVR